jgi:predicted SAM-dependent methyltransferase
MRLVNLGCGNTYHKDWINIDFKSNNRCVIEHNLLSGIPLEDTSVDVVYHSHVLEHFSKKDGVIFLEECFRVLKPGGIIRITVPDLERIAKEYLRNLELAKSGSQIDRLNYDWIKLELLDQLTRHQSGGSMLDYLKNSVLLNEDYITSRLGQEVSAIRKGLLKNKSSNTSLPRDKSSFKKRSKRFIKKIKKSFTGLFSERLPEKQLYMQEVGAFRLGGEVHQWMYDEFSLSIILNDLGFIQVKKVDAFKSDILDWQLYNMDVADGKTRKPDSLFIEASKL